MLKESENGKGENMIRDIRDDPLSATRISALLDFYSDRAVAHASFFVASIFGLVTLLSIVQQLNMHLTWFSIPLSWYSTPLFFAFSYVGYYTLGRFRFFADISDKLSEHGLKSEETLQGVPFEPTKTLKKYIHNQEELQKKVLILKTIITNRWGKYILPLLYWGIVCFLGSIVYSKFWNSWIDWTKWFGILAILVVISVIIPLLCYRKSKENRNITIYDIPANLLHEFSEKVVRLYYPGGISQAIKDLMKKAVEKEKEKKE
jgi:hypothetical protein